MIEWEDLTPLFRGEPLWIYFAEGKIWVGYQLVKYGFTDERGERWTYSDSKPETIARILGRVK